MSNSLNKTRRIRTAFVLGAGLGTRLRPLTNDCPKPLLNVAGRPIITYAMDHLLSAGVERFIVNTHHRAGMYERVFPGWNWRGIPIIFRHEPVLLDTGGGLKNIEDLLDPEETIFVYNGDVITDLPLQRLAEAHQERKAEVTLALRSGGHLLNVSLDEKGEICDMRGLLGNPGVKRCQFTGLYIVEKSFLGRMEAGRVESVVPVWAGMISENPGSVAGIVIDEGEWHDIGSVEEYEKVKTGFKALRQAQGDK
jgi:mannose-1-phosphate guanylyltransferase